MGTTTGQVAAYGARATMLSRAGELGERWIAAEAGRFVPWLAVAMTAGALAYLSLRWEPQAWLGPVVAAVAAVACILLRTRLVLRAAAAMLLAGSLGFLSGQAAMWRAPTPETLPTRAVVLEAQVAGVDPAASGRRVLLRGAMLPGAAAPLVRTLRIRLHPRDNGEVLVGDAVRVRALLRPPSSPAVPGGWDLQRDGFFSGLAGYGRALGPMEVISRTGLSAPGNWWSDMRDRVARRVAAALPGAAGGVAVTLLTGSANSMPEPDRAAFRDSGLAHLLAVAGLHIGAVMGLVFWGTRFLLAWSERAALHLPLRAIAAGTALLAGAGYAALTGGHVPVLRSLAMACLVTLGLLLGRRALSLRGLALAACAILLWAPHEAAGVSFQMSFSAVLALIAGFEALRPALARVREGGGWARNAAAHVLALALTSLLAGTASAPFGAYHFGHVQLYYVAANLVAVPVCAFLSLPLGLLALLLMPFGLEGVALAPMGWSIDAILLIARSVASWPAAVMAVPHIPAWGLAVLSLGLAWLGLWRSRARLAGIPLVLLGILSPLVDRPPDILVSADARLIGVRGPDGVLVQAHSGGNAFVRDAFLVRWGVRDAMAFPKPGAAPRPGLECGKAACRVGPERTGLVLRAGPAPEVDCNGIAVVVAPEPARGACPAEVSRVDRFSAWRDGAHAIWLGQGTIPRILSDRQDRGARPWVPPPPTARPRPVPPLPMAETEEAPPQPPATTEGDQ